LFAINYLILLKLNMIHDKILFILDKQADEMDLFNKHILAR